MAHVNGGAADVEQRDPAVTTAARLFAGPGEMRARCRALDWAATPLGPVAGWPQSLRTSVSLCLASGFPKLLMWGPELVQLYNDAFRPVLQVKHPAALGQRARDCWPELWDGVGPMFQGVLTTGESVYLEDQLFTPERQGEAGRVEEAYFTFSYSAVPDESYRPAGILATTIETTRHVQSRGVRERALERANAELRAAAAERERLLAESEAARRQVTATLESISDAFYAVDADFRFTYVNRKAEALWGRARETLLGRHYWTEFPQAVGSEPHRRHLEVMAERRPAHFEAHSPIIRRWLEVSLYPDAAGGGLACYFRDVTERHAAEEALRDSERQFRLMADAVPQIVWTTDPDGRTEFFNKQWADYTGAPYEPTTAAAVAARFVHPDDGAATMAAFAEAQRTAGPFAVEHRIRSAAGEYRWFLVRAEPYRDPRTGAVLRWYGASVDIHDRKIAEADRARLLAELGAERERLRALVLLMPAPVALHEGPEHRYALVNDAYQRLSGRWRAVAGRTPPEAFPELTGSGIFEALDRVYATGEPWAAPESPLPYDKDGSGRLQDAWFTIRFEPVRDATGQVVGIINFSIDVTDQVLARRAVEGLLAESERARAGADLERRRLETVLQELPVGVAFAEAPSGRIVQVSAATARIWGAAPHTARAADYSADYVGYRPGAAAPVASHEWPLARALAAGEVVAEEVYDVVRPDGSRRLVGVSAAPVRDAEGAVQGAVAVSQDVTERERLLAAAEAARTAAEAANRAKGEFLAVMSHELRTPLNAIGGYAELIELGIHGPVTDAQRAALERIQRSQRHLLGLIAGVLDYSRIEAGAVTYRLTDVPVTEAVAEAELLVAPQLRAKGLGYAWSEAAPGLCVRADREKLQQVLLNLLGNAVKFTDARDGVPGRIEVSCTRAEGGGGAAAGDRVRLHVRDTGAGIAAAERERVFEPFVQADQRLTRPHAGVGLGLAISRDLARGMGGDLTVESAPGVGSTFTLTLPRA